MPLLTSMAKCIQWFREFLEPTEARYQGNYVSVEPFHRFCYLDEQAFRYNNRKEPMDDLAWFEKLLSMVTGKQVQYKELTGKTPEAAF
jgi:hypothetical protein